MDQLTRTKRCPKCRTDRDYSWFSRDRRRRDWRTAWCKPCLRAAQRERRVGITQAEFDAMLREQEGRCGICRTAFDADPAMPNPAAVPRIDRTQSGIVRGLLCPRCRVGLATFRDDSMRLRHAATYLDIHHYETNT